MEEKICMGGERRYKLYLCHTTNCQKLRRNFEMQSYYPSSGNQKMNEALLGYCCNGTPVLHPELISCSFLQSLVK